ncbi:hypothetical protein ACQ4PT_071719 [Festuca glaucescens]
MENYYSYDYGYATEPVWVGVKRGHEGSEGKLDAAVMEKRYRCDDDEDGDPRWKHVAAYAPSARAKRGYKQSEDDAEADKQYKCNYWEDPACASLLQSRGGRKAKYAAQLNRCDRRMKETDEWCAATLREGARKALMF